MNDALERLLAMPATCVAELLPHRWPLVKHFNYLFTIPSSRNRRGLTAMTVDCSMPDSTHIITKMQRVLHGDSVLASQQSADVN